MTTQPSSEVHAESLRKDEPSWAIPNIRSREIMEDLAWQIADGELAEDTPMPSIQELQNTYDIPGSIVRSVLRELVDRKYIRRVPNRGYLIGVPGATPIPPRDDDPDAIRTYVLHPRSSRLPIPSADVLLTRRKPTGENTTRDRTAATGPRPLTGPAAIDRDGDTCIYTQVADIMAERINAGEFPIGERFAGIAELRREFAIFDATTRRALRELTDRGLLHAEPGRATFTGPADAGHPRPHYQRIAADLAGQIYSGQIPINDMIPTRENLRARHGVCDQTVEQAVRLLRSLGRVTCVPYRRPVAAPPPRWPVSPGEPTAS